MTARQPAPEVDSPAIREELPAEREVSHLVGIGSSAGGLEALQHMLRALPRNESLAYIVAQHISPLHRSLMADRLDHETPLRVTKAADGMRLEPNHIYLSPPNADITVTQSRIKLQEPMANHGPEPSVDELFLSMAREWGDRAIGVLLSGTGSDGSYGMRQIHSAGGLTIAQEPTTAQYDGMPLTAIQAGVCDLILAPGDISAALIRLVHGDTSDQEEPAPEVPQSFLRQVLHVVLKSTGADLSQYKADTVKRQIGRRMSVLQLPDEAEYLTYLRANEPEARLLRHALLFPVTSFYRDPAAWAALQEVMARRLADWKSDRSLRVWVPGCACGEDAYSVAMMLTSLLGGPANLGRRLKVFATDRNENSLEFARRGVYPKSAVAALPPGWTAKYFSDQGKICQVIPALRDSMVFAKHNLAVDPAFVRLDLICMRNVLIDFDNDLQGRVLRALHHALRPDGVLMLGGSDGVDPAAEWFTTLDARNRIFLRAAGPTVRALDEKPLSTQPPDVQPPHARRSDDETVLRDALLKALAPTLILLNESDHIVQILGDPDPYASLPSAAFDSHATSALRPELAAEVRSMLIHTRSTRQVCRSRPVRLGSQFTTVAARMIPTAMGNYVALTFEDSEAPAEEEASDDAAETAQVARLKRELASSQHALQATIGDLETSNEELQATNEALISLNDELEVRQRELTIANEDLVNIQEALAQAIVIVDNAQCITRYSPMAVRVFGLVESDIGRPITAIPTTVQIKKIGAALTAVIGSGERRTIEAAGDQGSFLLSLVPYRGLDNQIKGAIVSISDPTASTKQRRRVEATLADLRAMTEGLNEMVWRREYPGGRLSLRHPPRNGAVWGDAREGDVRAHRPGRGALGRRPGTGRLPGQHGTASCSDVPDSNWTGRSPGAGRRAPCHRPARRRHERDRVGTPLQRAVTRHQR